MGLGFTVGLTCIGIVREFIGTGKIFGIQILLADAGATELFILPAGAFLVLAILSCRYEQTEEQHRKARRLPSHRDAVQTVHHAADAAAESVCPNREEE